MRERLRFFFAACCYYSGLVRLAIWWQQRHGPYLAVLNYHRAGKQIPNQVRYLRKHYRIMHLEEALEELYSGKQNTRDTRPMLALTFDDGYLDNYVEGLKSVRELQVPITIFLIPGYIESGACFWWLAPEYLAKGTQVEKVTIQGRTYQLNLPEERQALKLALYGHLRFSPSVEERERFVAEIQQALAVKLPRRVVGEPWDNLSLPVGWEQVHEMEESGWVSFGGHTMHHPILSYLVDGEECKREVAECREVLEHHLGHSVNTFAYPVGQEEHIGEQSLQAVKEAGFKWAFSTVRGINRPQMDPLLLRRLPGDYDAHWLITASVLTGLLGIFSRFRKKDERAN